MIVVITDRESRVEKNGSVVAQRDNKLAWISHDGRKVVIAVGGRHQWNSSLPLPPEATLTDLVSASMVDPALAESLWGPFLLFLLVSSKPSGWKLGMMPIFPGLWPISVRNAIADPARRSAVRKAIASLRYPRVRILGSEGA